MCGDTTGQLDVWGHNGSASDPNPC